MKACWLAWIVAIGCGGEENPAELYECVDYASKQPIPDVCFDAVDRRCECVPKCCIEEELDPYSLDYLRCYEARLFFDSGTCAETFLASCEQLQVYMCR